MHALVVPRQLDADELEELGAISFHRESRLPSSSVPASVATPVTFPPGRARLVTIPNEIGSAVYPTTGTVLVVSFSTFTKRDENAKITSG